MARIAFVTCRDLSRYFPGKKNPLFTHDDQVAVDALVGRGHVVEPLVWDQPPGTGFDLMVIRSTWDYMDDPRRRAAFRSWIDEVEAAGLPVENPPAVLRWNLDKHYLGDLERAGVHVVPSRYLPVGEPVDLVPAFEELGELVLKPCVSAAAQGARRVRTMEEARSFDAGVLRSDCDSLVQPFLPEVTERGEWSCVFIDGAFTHAVLKRPAEGSWLVQDELGGSVLTGDPPTRILALARRAIEVVPAALLYGRVDVIPCDQPLVGEVELIEPELFFLECQPGGVRPHPKTVNGFVEAVERRLG